MEMEFIFPALRWESRKAMAVMTSPQQKKSRHTIYTYKKKEKSYIEVLFLCWYIISAGRAKSYEPVREIPPTLEALISVTEAIHSLSMTSMVLYGTQPIQLYYIFSALYTAATVSLTHTQSRKKKL
jgi:hypothetical protein